MEENTALEQIKKIKGLSSEQQKVIVGLSLAVSLLISAVCLSFGVTTVFPHIFYIPIILAAYWYPHKGILFSAGTGAAYLFEVALFNFGFPALLFSALIRAVVFIDIGVVISLLRREGEEYRGLANRAIQELDSERERYEAVVETQTEFICRFLPDGTTTFANQAYCRYFGKRQDEIIGQIFNPNIHPDDRRKVQQLFSAITPGHPIVSIEHRNIMQDGTIHWQQWVDQGIFDKNGVLKEYQSVGRDVTEQKEAERDLQKSEEKFRSVAENSSDLLVLRNSNGNATFVSPSVRKILGYDPKEFLTLRPHDFFPPKQYATYRLEFDAIIKSGHQVRNLELRCQRKDGTEAIIIYTGDPIIEDGVITGYQAVGKDVTQERKDRRALEQSLEEKTILLQEVHHRVKNNLAIIVGLISMQMEKVEDPSTRGYLLDTENRIMALANVHEAVYLSKDVAAINMTDHIENLGGYILASGNSNFAYNLHVHQTDCQVSLQTAIPVSLILNEMITNSLKHAFIGKDSGTITICFECTGGNYILTYSDDGVGIDNSLDISSTKSLGISLIHRLATAQLKGTIEQSNKNGTTWVIRFPKDD